MRAASAGKWSASRALVLAGLGVVIGLAAAYACAGVLASMLFETSPTDPVTFAAAGGGLLLVALAAAWWPARRAASVDPLTALRAE